MLGISVFACDNSLPSFRAWWGAGREELAGVAEHEWAAWVSQDVASASFSALDVVLRHVVHPGLLGGCVVEDASPQGGIRMRLHGNARSCPHSCRLIAVRVLEQGGRWRRRPMPRARACAQLRSGSLATRAEGGVGLVDRSSAPLRVPSRTREERVELVAFLRGLRMTAAEIAEVIGMPLSIVSAVLATIGLGKRNS